MQPFQLIEQEFQFGNRWNETKGDCFQILGFDVFIDSDLKAWVLEVNDHPSLNILLTKEGPNGLLKFPSEVDKFIKTKVVGDAISLMRQSKHKSDRGQVQQHGCWQRILPSVDDEEYLTFSKAKFIYEMLQGRKGTSTMSQTGFNKLAKIGPLKSKIQRVQLDLLYRRVLVTNNSQLMDLNTFFDAMEELATTLLPGQLGRCDALMDLIIDNIYDILPKPSVTTKSSR